MLGTECWHITVFLGSLVSTSSLAQLGPLATEDAWAKSVWLEGLEVWKAGSSPFCISIFEDTRERVSDLNIRHPCIGRGTCLGLISLHTLAPSPPPLPSLTSSYFLPASPSIQDVLHRAQQFSPALSLTVQGSQASQLTRSAVLS